MSFDTDENRPSKVYATNYHPTPPPQGKKSIDWFLSNPASIPSPMRYWIVFSTARMFTRPVHHLASLAVGPVDPLGEKVANLTIST